MESVIAIDQLRAAVGAAPARPRARIITVHQHKGGVGKTRIAIELACVLSGGTTPGAHWNVPFIDLDATSGGNATRLFGIHFSSDPTRRPRSTLLSALASPSDRPPRLHHTDLKGWRMPFVPGHPDIVENQIPRADLRAGLQSWATAWHAELGSPYLVIDTVPGRNPLTDGAIQASDLIVVPTLLAKESLNALEDLLAELREGGDYLVMVAPNIIKTQVKETLIDRLAEICAAHPGMTMSPFIKEQAPIQSRQTALPITHYRNADSASWRQLRNQYIAMATAAQQAIDDHHAVPNAA